MSWFMPRDEYDHPSFRFTWPPDNAGEAIDDLAAEISASVATLILPAVQMVSESARNAARDLDIDLDFIIEGGPFEWALPDDAFSFAIA